MFIFSRVLLVHRNCLNCFPVHLMSRKIFHRNCFFRMNRNEKKNGCGKGYKNESVSCLVKVSSCEHEKNVLHCDKYVFVGSDYFFEYVKNFGYNFRNSVCNESDWKFFLYFHSDCFCRFLPVCFCRN